MRMATTSKRANWFIGPTVPWSLAAGGLGEWTGSERLCRGVSRSRWLQLYLFIKAFTCVRHVLRHLTYGMHTTS